MCQIVHSTEKRDLYRSHKCSSKSSTRTLSFKQTHLPPMTVDTRPTVPVTGMLDTLPLSNNRHHPTKASVAESNHTEITCIESYDDDIQHQQDQRRVMVLPNWVSASREPCCDEGSVSLLSTSDETDSQQRRSIFSKHWENSPTEMLASKGSRLFPKEMIVTHHCPFASESEDENDDEENDDGNTCGRTTVQRMQEGVQLSSSEFNHDRRRIFAGCFIPESSPIMKKLPSYLRRNAVSDSALIMKKLPSCLRPPRYSSGGELSRHTDRSVSVSFCSAVAIVKYEIPREQWAASGWSNFFH